MSRLQLGLGQRGQFRLGLAAGLSHPPGSIIDENFASGSYWPRPIATELSCSRASSKYGEFINSTAITSFLSNILAITDNLSVEPAGTNRCLESQTLAQAPWTQRGVTITTGATGPDGSTALARLTLGAAGVADLYQVNFPIANGRYEPSFYLRRVSTTGVMAVQNGNDGAIGGKWLIDLAVAGAGLTRITRSHPAVTISNEFTATGAVSGLQFIANSGTVDVDIGFVSAETGTVSTSYILTTTVAVTRAADSIQIQRIGIGRLVFTFDDNSQQTISGIDTGTQYTLLTSLNRARIKRMTGYAA